MMRVPALLAMAGSRGAQVTYERVVNAAREPQNWLTYWGDYGAVRYRELNLPAYLDTLCGGVNAGADVRKAEGIR